MKKVLLALAAACIPCLSQAAPPSWLAMKSPEKLTARPGKSRFAGAVPVTMKAAPTTGSDQASDNYNFFQMTANEPMRDAVAEPRKRSPRPAQKRPVVDPASEPRI